MLKGTYGKSYCNFILLSGQRDLWLLGQSCLRSQVISPELVISGGITFSSLPLQLYSHDSFTFGSILQKQNLCWKSDFPRANMSVFYEVDEVQYRNNVLQINYHPQQPWRSRRGIIITLKEWMNLLCYWHSRLKTQAHSSLALRNQIIGNSVSTFCQHLNVHAWEHYLFEMFLVKKVSEMLQGKNAWKASRPLFLNYPGQT